MNLLIPYVKLPDHNDPLFEEFTYGNRKRDGRKLRQLRPGDHIFFHTTIGRVKCITAYFTVARAMDTADVLKDPDLTSKFRSPHITRCLEERLPPMEDDVIVFGDPVSSRILSNYLPFDRALASQLSLGIAFPEGRLDSQSIGSATRSWRELTDKDVRILQEAMRLCEEAKHHDDGALSLNEMLTTEEVSQVVEKHIEGLLANNPRLLSDNVTSVRRQVETDEGRIDVLLETRTGDRIVVEVKLHRIGRDAIQQLRNYMRWARGGRNKRSVSGVLVCEGVLPAFADDVAKLNDIKVLRYGWKLNLSRWASLD